MIAAFVLAAGVGSRLRPLTDALPKPLVPIGDRSAFATIVATLRGSNFSRIVANSWHAKEALAAAARPLDVAVSAEETLLGTAGGLRRASSLLGAGDVLVWNGDILANVDACAVAEAHQATNAAATLVVKPVAQGLGNVGLDAFGRVVRLRQERFEAFGREVLSAEFLGIHAIGNALREAIPEVGCLVTDGYLPALRRGATLGSYVHDAPFFDVGTPERYLAANRAWLAARGLRTWRGEGAQVRGSEDASVVGAGARIDGAVIRSVVWESTVFVGDLVDAIATPAGVLRASLGRDE